MQAKTGQPLTFSGAANAHTQRYKGYKIRYLGYQG